MQRCSDPRLRLIFAHLKHAACRHSLSHYAPPGDEGTGKGRTGRAPKRTPGWDHAQFPVFARYEHRMIVLVPHRLGRQEARRRLDSGLDRLRRELSVLLSGLDYYWQGDTLNFTASAMWQRLTGRIEVLDDAVRVEIELPRVLQLLRDAITKRVRGRGIALLEKPPGEA